MNCEESDKCNNVELFEEIKDKCKSRAKQSIYTLLIGIILAIVLLIYFGQRLSVAKNMIEFIFWIVITVIGSWLILYNYRYKKKIDNLDTPNQLLPLFKKNTQIEIISGGVVWLLLIVLSFVIDNHYMFITMLTSFLLVLFMAIKGYGHWYSRGKEITEQLQELIERN